MTSRAAPGPQKNEDPGLDNQGPRKTVQRDEQDTTDPTLPQYANRLAFLIFALMIGAVPPARVTERIIADLEVAE